MTSGLALDAFFFLIFLIFSSQLRRYGDDILPSVRLRTRCLRSGAIARGNRFHAQRHLRHTRLLTQDDDK